MVKLLTILQSGHDVTITDLTEMHIGAKARYFARMISRVLSRKSLALKFLWEWYVPRIFRYVYLLR